MNLYGWIFMSLSWGAIILMTVYCLVKILRTEKKPAPSPKKKPA